MRNEIHGASTGKKKKPSTYLFQHPFVVPGLVNSFPASFFAAADDHLCLPDVVAQSQELHPLTCRRRSVYRRITFVCTDTSPPPPQAMLALLMVGTGSWRDPTPLGQRRLRNHHPDSSKKQPCFFFVFYSRPTGGRLSIRWGGSATKPPSVHLQTTPLLLLPWLMASSSAFCLGRVELFLNHVGEESNFGSALNRAYNEQNWPFS